MFDQRYKFNRNKLTYEKIGGNIIYSFWKFIKLLIISIVITILLYCVFANFIDSPKERKLKEEISWLSEQYIMLNMQLDEIDSVLNIVRYHDDNIYRVIFEVEPIPQTIRKAGFGGINRYNNLGGYNNSATVIGTAKRLDILLTQMYIQVKSYEELTNIALEKKEMLGCIPAIQPVDNKDLKKISSGFGMRIHPILSVRRLHQGIDYTIKMNSRVYATGGGVVSDIIYSKQGKGKYIEIEHGYGYKTLYAHLSEILVVKGQKVKRGDIIALTGNSGFSTAPHLHYEVHKENKSVNPVNFYFQDVSPKEYKEILELASKDNINNRIFEQ
ncbi:MAG: M23 family metallopeptidase [Bacteroidia bacterium]|nr:M23 family metallopeptidase [Bacteroidia bacterium]